MNEPAYLVLLQPFSDGEALLSGTTHASHANALMMKERRKEGTKEPTNERKNYHRNGIGMEAGEEDGIWDSLWDLKVIP